MIVNVDVMAGPRPDGETAEVVPDVPLATLAAVWLEVILLVK